MSELIRQYRDQVMAALATVLEDDLVRAVDALLRAHEQGARVLVLCGPDSVEDVSHLAHELEQGIDAGPFGFRLVRLYEALRRQTSWAYEDLYAEQLRGEIHPGDIVVAISRRGQALGLANALRTARRAGATTIAMVGFDGGAVKEVADICLHVRSDRAEQVEDVQTMLTHLLCVSLRQQLSGAPRPAAPVQG